MMVLWILLAALALPRASAQYFLYSGQSSAQTQIDVNHQSTWLLQLTSGTLAFGGAKLTMKLGPSTVQNVTFSFYNGTSTSGPLFRQVVLTPASLTQSFTETLYAFPSPVTLVPGYYYATLTSPAVDTQSTAYFIKGYADAFVSNDGTTVYPSMTSISDPVPTVTPTGAPTKVRLMCLFICPDLNSNRTQCPSNALLAP